VTQKSQATKFYHFTTSSDIGQFAHPAVNSYGYTRLRCPWLFQTRKFRRFGFPLCVVAER